MAQPPLLSRRGNLLADTSSSGLLGQALRPSNYWAGSDRGSELLPKALNRAAEWSRDGTGIPDAGSLGAKRFQVRRKNLECRAKSKPRSDR